MASKRIARLKAEQKKLAAEMRVESTEEKVEAALRAGREAVEQARLTRSVHRKRKLDHRTDDLVAALAALKDAMKLVRPLVHRASWRYVPKERELRRLSQEVQAEKRKIRKMLNRDLSRQGVVGLDGGWS